MGPPGTDGPPSTPPADAGGRGRLSADEFADRFQESAPILWTIAAGILGDGSQAEDVLQDAAVIALEKLDQFDPSTRFSAWMGQVVRNVALNLARKGRRQATRATEPEVLGALLVGPGATSEAALDAAGPVGAAGELLPDTGEFDDRVRAALEGLDPVPRATLLLRTVLGLEYREISAVLGVPEGTAMSHVHRARRALRQRLGAEADPVPAAARGKEAQG